MWKESARAGANPRAMTEHQISRTLVKSPSELWAECSDATALSRHLQEVGRLSITELEPERRVAWEGELASGTVRLEPSAWGTKVILTARPAGGAVPEAREPGRGVAAAAHRACRTARAATLLSAALDSLGRAHRRPFSRR